MDEIFKIIGEAVLRSEAESKVCLEASNNFMCVSGIDNVLVELHRMSEENLEALHKKVLLYICSNRLPKEDGKYYEFYDIDTKSVSFNSVGVSWVDGKEERVARAVGSGRIYYIRSKAEHPVYVIETESELELWKVVWRGRAFLTSALVDQFFPVVL